MGENQKLVVYQPEEGEALQHYLERPNEVFYHQVISNEELSIKFASLLIEGFGKLARLEDALENLWAILDRMNNIDDILSKLRRAECVRRNLLDSIDRSIDRIQNTYDTTNYGRLLGSILDLGGTVSGIIMKSSYPDFSKYAFNLSLCCGFFSFIATGTEIHNINQILNELLEKVNYDRETFAPIQRWYEQTEDLKNAMQVVFPFGESLHVREVLIEAVEVTPVRLLATLIRSVGQQDISSLRSSAQILNLIGLSLNQNYRDLYQWFYYRRHPVLLDAGRIVTQQIISSLVRSLLDGSSPVLSHLEENLSPFSFWLHIGLELSSIRNCLQSVRGISIPPILDEIRHFRQYMHKEFISLQRLIEFIALRRNRKRGREVDTRREAP